MQESFFSNHKGEGCMQAVEANILIQREENKTAWKIEKEGIVFRFDHRLPDEGG
jgi:hypothetical protein